MKVSFDGLRTNIAKSFNRVAEEIKEVSSDRDGFEELKEATMDLRSMIAGLLGCQIPEDMPADGNDLSFKIKLVNVDPENYPEDEDE